VGTHSAEQTMALQVNHTARSYRTWTIWTQHAGSAFHL
jgi:hypothetical protein